MELLQNLEWEIFISLFFDKKAQELMCDGE